MLLLYSTINSNHYHTMGTFCHLRNKRSVVSQKWESVYSGLVTNTNMYSFKYTGVFLSDAIFNHAYPFINYSRCAPRSF